MAPTHEVGEALQDISVDLFAAGLTSQVATLPHHLNMPWVSQPFGLYGLPAVLNISLDRNLQVLACAFRAKENKPIKVSVYIKQLPSSKPERITTGAPIVHIPLIPPFNQLDLLSTGFDCMVEFYFVGADYLTHKSRGERDIFIENLRNMLKKLSLNNQRSLAESDGTSKGEGIIKEQESRTERQSSILTKINGYSWVLPLSPVRTEQNSISGIKRPSARTPSRTSRKIRRTLGSPSTEPDIIQPNKSQESNFDSQAQHLEHSDRNESLDVTPSSTSDLDVTEKYFSNRRGGLELLKSIPTVSQMIFRPDKAAEQNLSKCLYIGTTRESSIKLWMSYRNGHQWEFKVVDDDDVIVMTIKDSVFENLDPPFNHILRPDQKTVAKIEHRAFACLVRWYFIAAGLTGSLITKNSDEFPKRLYSAVTMIRKKQADGSGVEEGTPDNNHTVDALSNEVNEPMPATYIPPASVTDHARPQQQHSLSVSPGERSIDRDASQHNVMIKQDSTENTTESAQAASVQGSAANPRVSSNSLGVDDEFIVLKNSHKQMEEKVSVSKRLVKDLERRIMACESTRKNTWAEVRLAVAATGQSPSGEEIMKIRASIEKSEEMNKEIENIKKRLEEEEAKMKALEGERQRVRSRFLGLNDMGMD